MVSNFKRLSTPLSSRCLVENQLVSFEQTEKDKFDSALKAKSNDFEIQDENELNQEMEWRTKYLYPKIFRGAFAVTLWAAYESSIIEIATFAGKSKGANPINEYKTSLVYLQSTFQLPSEETQKQLDGLYAVRNAYAHANGRLTEDFGSNEIRKLIRAHKIEKGLDDIIITEEYLNENV